MSHTIDLDALQLVCPITAELFEDPVILVEDGYTYERSAVTAWLEQNDTSPMSGAALVTKTLAPNIRARQQADAARGGGTFRRREDQRGHQARRSGGDAANKFHVVGHVGACGTRGFGTEPRVTAAAAAAAAAASAVPRTTISAATDGAGTEIRHFKGFHAFGQGAA